MFDDVNRSAELSGKGWRKVKLGKVLELKYGFGLPEVHRTSGDVPVYGSSGIVGTHSEPAVRWPGVIVGRKGHVGSVYYAATPFYPIDTVYYADQLKIPGDLKFFYYLLQRVPFQQVSSDVGVPGLKRDIAYGLEVLLPEDPVEQRRIADTLSAFDDKIELNNKISRTLEEIAQAIFKERFVKYRFPGHENAEFFDSDLGKIPKGWEVRRLGDILKLQYGKALKAEDRRSGSVLVIGSSGVLESHNRKLVSGPGIVVGRKGVVGSVLQVEEDFYPIDTTFYVETEIDLYFCYFLLRRQKFVTGDSAVPGLNREIAHGHRIVVPPSDLIREFGSLVTPMFAQRFSLEKENQELTALRDLLLSKLMSGEVKV